MLTVISDIKSNIDLIAEELSGLFHDLGVKFYSYAQEGKFVLHFPFRPFYEIAKRSKWLGIFPGWKMPVGETFVEISPIKKIIQIESDSGRSGDCFLSFDVNKETNKLQVNGVLDKYILEFDNNTLIKIYNGGSSTVSKLKWGFGNSVPRSQKLIQRLANTQNLSQSKYFK